MQARSAAPIIRGLKTMSTARSGTSRWGLVLARPPHLLISEPFYTEFVDGVEEAFLGTGAVLVVRLVTSTAKELDVYRDWATTGFVEGVLLVNAQADDPRPALLRELGLKGVMAGAEEPVPGLGCVRAANATPAFAVIERLAGMGHTVVARVSGPRALQHTRVRDEACRRAAERHGVDLSIVPGEYTAKSGEEATLSLLTRTDRSRPTAIVFDNDTMALAGLHSAGEAGIAVPDELSIVAWDDSPACELANPPIAAVAVDVHEFGRLAGQCALTEDPASAPVLSEPPYHWIPRASVGAAPGR